MPPNKCMDKLTGNSPSPLGRGIKRTAAVGVSFASALLVAGCSRAPSFNILGSFFPAWIGCGVIGILLAVAVRLFFVHIKLEDKLLWPLILVYPCLTLFFTFTLWLLFFS
jgi:YtcA family